MRSMIIGFTILLLVIGKYGYLDLSGNVFIQPQFDFASSVKEEFAIVRVGYRAYKIDIKGRPFQAM